MKTCSCRPPIDSVDPRTEGTCTACGFRLPPGSDQLGAFLDRLAEATPTAIDSTTGEPSPTWAAFRHACESREREGRHNFGYAFHSRNNIREAQEEAADGANYACFDHLVRNHREGTDGDVDLALTAAQKFYEAYESLVRLQGKRRGAP